MTYAIYAILIIIAFFFFLLGLKAATGWRFCVICTSVSLTWLGLLAARILGHAAEPTVFAFLVGETAAGTYLLLDRRMSEHLHLYRLPILLTLTAGGFALVVPEPGYAGLTLAAACVWIAFIIIGAYRRDARVRGLVDRIVACCRDW